MLIGRVCLTCGKEIPQHYPSGERCKPGRYQKRQYCGLSCAAKALGSERGKKAAGHWHNPIVGNMGMHARARKFLKEVCEICGGTRRLSVHHKDTNPQNNDLVNLQTVCTPCHNRIHRSWEKRWGNAIR
jgi:hypothetical protein